MILEVAFTCLLDSCVLARYSLSHYFASDSPFSRDRLLSGNCGAGSSGGSVMSLWVDNCLFCVWF